MSCTIDELSSQRAIRKEGDKILADHKIYIDYISDIDIDDRLKVDDDEFKIYRIHNPNRLNRHLEIYCLKMERGTEVGDS